MDRSSGFNHTIPDAAIRKWRKKIGKVLARPNACGSEKAVASMLETLRAACHQGMMLMWRQESILRREGQLHVAFDWCML